MTTATRYEIHLFASTGGTQHFVENVVEVRDIDGILYFNDENGCVAYAAPKNNLLFFRREK